MISATREDVTLFSHFIRVTVSLSLLSLFHSTINQETGSLCDVAALFSPLAFSPSSSPSPFSASLRSVSFLSSLTPSLSLML